MTDFTTTRRLAGSPTRGRPPRALLVLTAALMALGLGACAPGQPSRVDVPGIAASDPGLEDLRPPAEKTAENMSLLIISEEYGIHRLPETRTDPTGIRLLAHRARQSLPPASRSAPIKVHHLVIYENIQAQLRAGAVAVPGGAIGSAITSAVAAQPPTAAPAALGTSAPDRLGVATIAIDPAVFAETAEKEGRRGLYTKEENPRRAPVRVIYIDTDIGGRRVASRSLVRLDASPEPALGETLDRAIGNHLALYGAGARP